MIKNENGITLIVLVITIIVLLILSGIVINTGLISVDTSEDTKLESELRIIEQVCIQEYTKAKQMGYLEKSSVPENFFGTQVSVSSLPDDVNWVFDIDNEPQEAYKGYFELTPDDLESLGIMNSEDTYIVNYYTGEVYNETRQKTSGNKVLYIKSVDNHQTENKIDNTSFVDNTWIE